MAKNISFVLVALFWVLMNALLWHSELGPGTELGASVPLKTVWERILSAPDDSTLSLIVEGKKIGFLRWRPTVGEAAATGSIASDNQPEGFVREISRYTVELEGSFLAEQLSRTLKLEGVMAFDRALHWQEYRLKALLRPMIWEVKSRAADKDIWFQAADGDDEWIRRLTYAELQNPERLVSELNLPLLGPMLSGATPGASAPKLNLSLDWQAHYDWLQIGRSRVRIYRLEAKLLEKFKIVVLVSRVGEILRVELPGEVKLVNDALFNT